MLYIVIANPAWPARLASVIVLFSLIASLYVTIIGGRRGASKTPRDPQGESSTSTLNLGLSNTTTQPRAT